jgi:hypothetical protein
MRGYASHLLFLFVLSCEQAPIQQTKKERAVLFLLSIVESGKWQGYLSRLFPHRILRLRHSFGDVAHAPHSNPIFHPKFESLAKQDFFYLYSRANLFANGYINKKNSVRDTFKLWKRPRGERAGWALRSRESAK